MERDLDHVNELFVQNDTATYRTGDPRTMLRHRDASTILDHYGPPRTLLSCSAKVEKGNKLDVLTAVLYMTPGLFCPSSTPECRTGCLGHTSGRMHQQGPTRARDQRAALYIEEKVGFLAQLKLELGKHRAKALKKGVKPAVRLNGTSDIAWEMLHREVFDDFPQIQFYDYTKVKIRMMRFLQRKQNSWPENYHLTFSGDQLRQRDGRLILQNGGNVAMVFSPVLPQRWWGYQVIDGDSHDARFLDPEGVIVGLKAKGIAQTDSYGFVAHVCPQCLPKSSELKGLWFSDKGTHRQVTFDCYRCGYHRVAKWKKPILLTENDCITREKKFSYPIQQKLPFFQR